MSNLERLIETLTRIAREGKPCPTNDSLAEELYISRAGTIAKVMERAENAGLIRVESFQRGRIVTIVQLGISTSEIPRIPHWRTRSGVKRAATRREPPIPAPEKSFTFVSRDPCPWCGVRQDLGCHHLPRVAA